MGQSSAGIGDGRSSVTHKQPELEVPADLPTLEAALADNGWFRAVADYTNDWESWHSPDGKLIWVNPAVERLTGYSVTECLNMTDYPLALIAEEDRERIGGILASALDRTSGEQVEFRSVHRQGDTRWMSLSWQPMYERQGRYLGLRTSIRDVTDRHKLREELRLHAEHLEQLVQERTAKLRQLEKRQRQMEQLAALGQLAAGVAHEINNPLAGMRNAFELIKSSLSPADEHYELLELIDREIERISAIIHQMYQLYRRAPQQASPFSLARIIGEVIVLLGAQAQKVGVRLHWSGNDDPLDVELAEGEVKQILYNLIRNAIQASPAGETVVVSAQRLESDIAVSVEDRGAGISPDVVPRVFDPFFTTKQTGPDGGMGLGLSVSRSLIEAMGGRIEVCSEDGRGSEFTAIFPRRNEE
jgi:two-component system sporulation sensor kinase C